MANTLSQEEMRKLGLGMPSPRHSTPQEPQQPPSRTNSARMKGDLPGRGFRGSDRPQMPSGWLNTNEGIKWNEGRVEAFAKMSAGRMTFAMLKKKDKE